MRRRLWEEKSIGRPQGRETGKNLVWLDNVKLFRVGFSEVQEGIQRDVGAQ